MENLEIKKLDGLSMDMVAENKKKLMELFPEVFTEEGIILDKLKTVFGEYVEDKDDYYNFTWNGKDKALRLSQAQSTGTLRPCKEESKNWDTTQNLYIEGDNLEVLMLLRKSYHGKIKMIYIDPPYNTGKDFVYKDNYKDNLKNYLELTNQVDEEGNKWSSNSDQNGRYHTDWLNMMYPRLRIARELLNEEGVIFVSIDDNEIYNLKKICDEIFGETNFVSCIANINNPKGRSDAKYFATAHEYILVYKKSDAVISGFDPEENVLKRYNKKDDDGRRYRHIDLRKTGDSDRREDRPKMFYYFMYNEKTGDFYPTIEDNIPEGYIKIYPTKDDGSDGRWRIGIDTAIDRINDLVPNYMSIKGKWTIVEKNYLTDDLKVKATTAWTFKDVNSERGTEQFVSLGFDKSIFPRPKPLGTIHRTIGLSTSESDIILDFFSGSATSAHAVLQQNADDGGNRKFIMVQIPEEVNEISDAYKAGYFNICEIGKERIRRAGDKLLEENKDVERIKNLDIGFKVFKLDSSNIKKWDANNQNIEDYLSYMVDNFVEGRTEEDVLYEIMLKYGIDLTAPIESRSIAGKNVYSIGFGALFVCLDMEITLDVVEGIVAYKDELEPARTSIIFRDNGFKDSTVKTNALQILRTNDIEEVMSI